MTIFLCAGCSTPKPFYTQAKEYRATFFHEDKPNRRHTYILQFDNNGRLINFLTLFQAAQDIRNSIDYTNQYGPITNIVVISYGWTHDLTTGELDYYNQLADYDRYFEKSNGLESDDVLAKSQTAVFCVSWNSTTAGPTEAIGDLLPETSLSGFIATPVSVVTFPLSVWSKAAVADKIGYQDLKRSLNYLCEEAYRTGVVDDAKSFPNFYFVGHSFGCRILAGALRRSPPDNLYALNKAQISKNEANPINNAMKYLAHVRGGIFIEPALTEGNLPDNTINFPLLVVQSRHDHLNSLLFPIASILFSPYVSSEYEPNINNWMFESTNGPTKINYYLIEPLKALGDILNVAIASPLIWPVSYVRGQWQELSDNQNWNWHTNYITDTLGQLPVIDIAVQEWAKNESYHKGAFNLGLWNESAARIGSQSPKPLNSIRVSNNGAAYLAVTNGIQFINAQTVVSESVYSSNIDYNISFQGAPGTHFVNGMVGWVDPVGSHSDYSPNLHTNDFQIFDLIHLMLKGAYINASSSH